jgi:hypothetical protein
MGTRGSAQPSISLRSFLRNQWHDIPQRMEHKAAKKILSLVFLFHAPLFVIVKNSHKPSAAT